MNATMYQPLPYNQMPPFLCAMNLQIMHLLGFFNTTGSP